MKPISRFRLTASALLLATLVSSQASGEDTSPSGWVITQSLTGFSHNTLTGVSERAGYARKGLVSHSANKTGSITSFWEYGAQSETVLVDGKVMVDGRSGSEARRIRSLRRNKNGSLVFVQSGKGPKSKVRINQDGKSVLAWPRRTMISILHFDNEKLIYSKKLRKSDELTIEMIPVDQSGELDAKSKAVIGKIDECEFLAGRSQQQGRVIELICDRSNGRGVYFRQPDIRLEKVRDTQEDDVLNVALLKQIDPKLARSKTGILSVTGSPDALHFYHAVNASLLRELGEPGSLGSDAAGNQSWKQSYRTAALGELYKKTGKAVFASLAANAIKNTLRNRNENLNISGKHNTGCAWSSKIYSKDKTKPISLMINQAVISNSLNRTCSNLGDQCDTRIRKTLRDNAICLAEQYEQDYDEKAGLYRIPYGANFRYDGIWAPWNWQMTFAETLKYASVKNKVPTWKSRSEELVRAFFSTTEKDANGALWRYWPNQYYAGWTETEKVSESIRTFKPTGKQRYEDISHAGISLSALCKLGMPKEFEDSLSLRLAHLLDSSFPLARDLDGEGPRSSKWTPAEGWDCLNNNKLKQLFSKSLPGANSGAKHLTYARMYDPAGVFQLTVKLYACTLAGCEGVRKWTFNSADEYLAASPFFTIQPLR